MILFIFKP